MGVFALAVNNLSLVSSLSMKNVFPASGNAYMEVEKKQNISVFGMGCEMRRVTKLLS